MKISRQAWKNYAKQLNDINSKAAEELFQWIEAWGVDENGLILDNITEAVDKYNNSFIDECNHIVKKYGEASGALAAMMYDAIAELEGALVDAAEIADDVPIKDIYKTVNGVLKTSRNPGEMVGAVSRLVKRVSADTTLKNAERDRAEFAWIPLGDTCAYCIALASRGWQTVGKNTYKDGHAEHIHSNCDCNYAVRFDRKSSVEGYDPDKYLGIYNSADGSTPNEKINSIRRMMYNRKTGELSKEEYAIATEYWKKLKEYPLEGKEKERIYELFDNNLSAEEKQMALVNRPFGNNRYYAVHKGHNQYKIYNVEPIEQTDSIVDEVLTEMFGYNWQRYLNE